MIAHGLRRLGMAALLASGAAVPAHAIVITTSNDAFGLANTLFLNVGGLTVNNAQFSSGALTSGSSLFQSGTFLNLQGTFGLPSPGIVLSTGNVNDFATGANAANTPDFGFGSTAFGVSATDAQNALLTPITGVSSHFDVVQLDVSFFSPGTTTATFFATFGSMEFPDFVGSAFTDGFGLYVNDVNVAGVLPTGAQPGGPLPPVNIDHPDMAAGVPGTILSDGGVLTPNGNPVLRFDVPIASGMNEFTVILGDASDGILDTTVYLSSFFAAPPTPGPGSGVTEFDPVLPSNPPDPVTGAFVIEIPEVPADTVVWIDPPVSIGFEYEVQGGPAFSSIVAPSLATVPNLGGYLITVGDDTAPLAPGASLDFFSVFGVQPLMFTLTGIDPALMLDPADPLAFPLGVAFNATAFQTVVLMTPITEDLTPIPLPAGAALYLGGLALAAGALRRRRKVAA